MKKIIDHIYQINLGLVNAFLIEDNGFTLIDTGYKNSLERIFKSIAKSGKNPNDIKQIILTHCHPDHAGSVAAICKKLNIPVFAHEEEAALIEEGISGRQPVFRSAGFANWMIYYFLIKNRPHRNEPVKIEELLSDNDVLPVAGGLQVIHTPGHSAGHISLLLKNEGLLIAGDICSNVSGLALSTVYEDVFLAKKSILKAANFNFEKAVFGHGKLLSSEANIKLKEKFGSERINNQEFYFDVVRG
jgi:glyoxylase-like metal-dependent hydrolase (beta-lactamase superfamily II)